MDKRDRSRIFRDRLADAMADKGLSKSALARATRVDRSTIGQLLNEGSPRLPNAQLVADAASVLGVSTDWLLGLTDRPETPGDLVAAAMALSPAERTSADEQLMAWHREAEGYKIRHVPATLPDILKTPKMLAWEYASFQDRDLPQSVEATQGQFDWLQGGGSDYEIALPLHEIEACASGTSYYKGLSFEVRSEQLNFIADQCADMYPSLRVVLFDAHTVYSSPVTIFGPKLAVVYIGQCYLAFRETARVRSLTDHFDWLVREAVVDARDVPAYIRRLLENETS